MKGWAESVTGSTVIVHLQSETASLKGVLLGGHSDAVILRDALARVESRGESPTEDPIGTVIVPRANIDFIQQL